MTGITKDSLRKPVFIQSFIKRHSPRPHIVFKKTDISCLAWPSCSPDRNILENVWTQVKYHVRSKIFDIQHIMKNIHIEVIYRDYKTLLLRNRALIQARGKCFKY